MLTGDVGVERLFEQNGKDVEAVPVHQIDGRLPALPHGTWYLNGPGRTSNYDVPHRHWLDGDGLIRAITFDAGGVTFASRFIRTRKFMIESDARRPVFRMFGTSFSGDRLNGRGTGLESPANVSVIHYAGTLLALGEQGEPWAFDPHTLETEGPFTAGGVLTPVTPFAAHAKVDLATGELFNFGVAFAAERPMLHVFRFDAHARLLYRSRIPLHCSCTLHDFALGRTVAVFHISPYVLDMTALRGGASVLDALTWRPDLGSRIHIVDRATGRELVAVAVGDSYCLHTINCYQDGRTVVVDLIEMTQPIYDAYYVPRLFERPVAARPVRLTIDLDVARVVSRQEIATDAAPEFPVVIPTKAQDQAPGFWALGFSHAGGDGAKFFNCVLYFSWADGDVADRYDAPPGIFVGGEPLIVCDAATTRPLLLCQLFDGPTGRTGAAVFDADTLSAGPVACVWWPSPTPMAFHGAFVPHSAAVGVT